MPNRVRRMEPRSIPREWYMAQTPTLSKSRFAEGSVRANGVDPSGSSCPRVQNSEISAWMPGIAWRSGGEAAPCSAGTET